MRRQRIGSLRQRLRLEKPIRSAVQGGAADVIWQPIATLWSEIRPISAKEVFRADASYGVWMYEIRIRFREDVRPEMRFICGPRIFYIHAVWDKIGDRRFLSCICKERER